MKNAFSPTRLISTSIVCIGLVAGLAGAASADAKGNTPFAFDFKYSPTELSTHAGAEKMLARLESKVRVQCSEPGLRSIENRNLVKACVTATMETAVATFGAGVVAEAYQSRANG